MPKKRHVVEDPLKRAAIDAAALEINDAHGNPVYFCAMMEDYFKKLSIHALDSYDVVESLECFDKFVGKYGEPEVI